MTRYLFAILIAYFASSPLAHAGSPVCYGSAKASKLVIYLHGLDSEKPSKQELANRKKLQEDAALYKVAVSVVRSKRLCERKGNKLLCWPMSSLPELSKEVTRLRSSAKKACAPKAKELVWAGFSNGGYFLGKAFQGCLFEANDQIIMVGSAGRSVPWEKKDLSKCGRAVVMIGEKDKLTIDAAKRFHRHILGLQANSKLVTYKGGHDFVKAPIFSGRP